MLKLHCTYRPSKQVEGGKKSKNMGYVHVNHRVSGHSLVGTYEIQQKKISWKNQKPVQSIQSPVDLCNVLQSSSSQWPTQFGKQCTKEALHAHSGALLVQHITFMWGTSAPCPHVPLEAKAFVQLHYYRITLLMQTETAVHFMRNWKRLHANQMFKKSHMKYGGGVCFSAGGPFVYLEPVCTDWNDVPYRLVSTVILSNVFLTHWYACSAAYLSADWDV